MKNINEIKNEQTIEITEDELLQLNGANNGDTQWEMDNDRFLYKVGDEVEVFNTGLHITTKRGKIIACLNERPGKPGVLGKKRYIVDTALPFNYNGVPADDIERKK